jgi:Phosphotransferase enzyme family
MEPPSRVVKADFAERQPVAVLADVHRVTGSRYQLVRRLPGGAWGAWEVVGEEPSHGRRRAVLKCLWETDWRRRAELATRAVQALRERALPVPMMLGSGHVPEVGTWLLAEYVPGSPVSQLTPALAADVVRFVEATAELLVGSDADFNWSDEVRRVLAPGSPELRRLRASGRAEARLADAAAAQAPQAEALPRHDAVHGDLLVTQLLTDASVSRLVGIVDWDAAGPGARAIDLALLFQNVEVQRDRAGIAPDPSVIDAIGTAGADAGSAGFVAAVHYHLVKMVGFVAAHNRPHLGWRLEVASRVLRNLGLVGGSP